jgi:hypothetical protein
MSVKVGAAGPGERRAWRALTECPGITPIGVPSFMGSGTALDIIGWFLDVSYFLLLNMKVPIMIMAKSKTQITRMSKYSG